MSKVNKVRKPNIVRGGIAIPLGRNYYYMSGRKHETGGIDIGKNPRTGLEVEDGEVMHIGDKHVEVFSAQPFLNGKSPAQRVMDGENPTKVFNAQESFKDRNKINDDGTKKKARKGGLYTLSINGKQKLRQYPSTEEIKLSKRQELTGTAVMRNGGRRKAYMGIDDDLVQENDATRTSRSRVNERKRRMYYGRDTQHPITTIINILDKKLSPKNHNPNLVTGVAPGVGFRGTGFNLGRNAVRTTARKVATTNSMRGAIRRVNARRTAKATERFNREGAVGKNTENALARDRVNRMTGRNNPDDGLWNRGDVPEGSLNFKPTVRERVSNARKAIRNKVAAAKRRYEISKANSANRTQSASSQRTSAAEENVNNAAQTNNTRTNTTNETAGYRPFRKSNWTKSSPLSYKASDVGLGVAGLGVLGIGGQGLNRLYNDLSNGFSATTQSASLNTPVGVNRRSNSTSNSQGNTTQPVTSQNNNETTSIAQNNSNEIISPVTNTGRASNRRRNKRAETVNNNQVITTSSSASTSAPANAVKVETSNNVDSRPIVTNNANTTTNNTQEVTYNTEANVPRAFAKRNRHITDTRKLEAAYNNALQGYPNWWQRTVRNVGNYIKENPGIVEDAVGLTSNVVSSFIGNAMNRSMLNSLRYSSAPIPQRAAKLKTRININPQLDRMRESLASYERAVDANTASSAVALARKQRARMANTLSTNEIYGDKENRETALINQDRLNQQEVANRNIDAYNTWAQGKADFENSIRQQKAENNIALMNNLNAGVQNVINNIQQRRTEGRNIRAMLLAYPDLPAEQLLASGLITQNEYDTYRKGYPLKGRKKINNNNNE